MAEHRLERVVPFADRMVLLDRRRDRAHRARPRTCWPPRPSYPRSWSSAGALGWSPLPMTVRDARRLARDLDLGDPPARRARAESTSRVLVGRGLTVVRGGTVALREVSRAPARRAASPP